MIPLWERQKVFEINDPSHVAEVRRLLIDDLTAGELATLARVGEKVLRRLHDGCRQEPESHQE